MRAAIAYALREGWRRHRSDFLPEIWLAIGILGVALVVVVLK